LGFKIEQKKLTKSKAFLPKTSILGSKKKRNSQEGSYGVLNGNPMSGTFQNEGLKSVLSNRADWWPPPM
jgi:hypothetical protein